MSIILDEIDVMGSVEKTKIKRKDSYNIEHIDENLFRLLQTAEANNEILSKIDNNLESLVSIGLNISKGIVYMFRFSIFCAFIAACVAVAYLSK